MDSVLDKTGRLNSNVEVGKFTCLISSTGTYKDGVDVPAGANPLTFLGVAQESILPNGLNDYSGGVYQITSGTAWPANSVPAVATGRAIGFRVFGITRVVAAGMIAVMDRVNIADAQGRVKTINEAAATIVNEVGFALDAAGAAGDVIRIVLTNIVRRAG